MIYVVNAVGTSDKKCPYGYDSWLDFWEKKPINLPHIVEIAVNPLKICAVGIFKRLNNISMVCGIESQDYILSPSAQNATIPKTTKFFMLMKKNW